MTRDEAASAADPARASRLGTLLTPEVAAHRGRTVTYTAPEAYGHAAFRGYARAIGDDDPRVTDLPAAREVGLRDVLAPATFVCDTVQYLDRPADADGYRGHRWDLPLPPDLRTLRGGHAYELLAPVHPDVVPTVTWTLEDLTETTTSACAPLLVVTSRVEHRDQHGTLLARDRETVLHTPLGDPVPADGAGTDPHVGAGTDPHVGAGTDPHVGAGTDPSVGAGTDPPADHTQPGVGAVLPPLRRHLTSVDLVAYAGATWDHHRLHHDQAYARERGLAAPLVDGQHLGALLAVQVQAALGPRWRVTALAFRVARPVGAGDSVEVTGTVVDRTSRSAAAPARLTVTQTLTGPGGVVVRDATAVAEQLT
jgi:acyl dehydratase